MTTTPACRPPQFITDGGIETHIIFNMGGPICSRSEAAAAPIIAISPRSVPAASADRLCLALAARNRGLGARNVRFGSLADKVTSPRHVRFTTNNGRSTAHPNQHFGCRA